MGKRKLKIRQLFLLILIICMLPARVLAETNDTKAETAPGIADAVPDKIQEGFELAAENETLELYLNTDSLAVQVRDKTNGNIYSSFAGCDENMNDSWRSFMASGVTLEYMSDDMKLVRKPFLEGGTSAQITKKQSGFEAKVNYEEGFSFVMRVALEENGLTVSVEDASINEPESGLALQTIYIYPFLGASYGETAGYLFVPDGCGALIGTDTPCAAQSGTYSKRIYGADYGAGDFNVLTERSMLKPAEQIYMPVYGIVVDENDMAVAAVIEDGDAYASIEACVFGRELPVSYETSKFIFRETYTRALNQSGDTMIANQKQRNHMDIKVHYYFLSGQEANYSGIAGTYRDYLKETGIFAGETDAGEDTIPMQLEILLSEQEERLIGAKNVTMTTKDQAEKIIEELYESGVNEMSVILLGYSEKGTGSAIPTEASFAGRIASKHDWNEMIEKWKSKNVSVGFYTNFSTASEKMGGYSKRKDIAQNMNEKLLQSYEYEPVYYLAPLYTKEKFEKESQTFKETGTEFIAMDGIGSRLYSNWNKKRYTTREESMDIYSQLKTEGINTAYYRPSSYVWKNTSEIYDIPSDSSDYLIFSQTVPFMQMVLKGHIDYFADISNFHADRKKDTLKMIEYGEYPAWLLTWEDSLGLFNTVSSWIYTSEYNIWKNEIIGEYQTISSALKNVRNAEMKEHRILQDGIAQVVYDNGTVITVNYTDEVYDSGEYKVDPLGFTVTRIG